jgi:hypothetical protein
MTAPAPDSMACTARTWKWATMFSGNACLVFAWTLERAHIHVTAPEQDSMAIGVDCDDNIDDCASYHCLRCDVTLTYACDCTTTGYTGPTCTVDRKDCCNPGDGLGDDKCRDVWGANVDNAALCSDVVAPQGGYSCVPSLPGVDCSTGFCLEIDGCAARYTVTIGL